MKRLSLVLALIITALLVGCTANQRARNFGGTQTVTLPKGRKVVNATWKQDNLWILTRAAKENETPETFEFKEDSSFGIAEGTVIIKEQ